MLVTNSNEAISINAKSKLHTTEQQQVITAMQKKAKIKLAQDHDTLRILVVFIFSLKVLLDLRYKRHPMHSALVSIFLLFFMKVTQLLEAETNKHCNQYQTNSTMTTDIHDFQM
jgi:hypothetical protein